MTLCVTYNITPDDTPSLILACLAMLVAAVMLFTYRRNIALVPRAVRQQSAEPAPDEDCPAVSVIVYAYNDAGGIAELLPQITGQDYPAEFEIIVVNDGRDDAIEALINNLGESPVRIYHTFTPKDTRNLSRKKLALTLGIKAARHEAIVNVTSETRIGSDQWLRRMAAPLADSGTELVIGYAAPQHDHGRGARNRDHDRLIDSVHYLSSALRGKAYRGDGDNLAYRRSTFFRLKGFSNSLNLHYGDDDIFVNDVATESNTAVMIADDAQVTAVTPDPAISYHYSKLRHAFTAKFAGRAQHACYGLWSALMWCWLAASVAAIALAPYSLPVIGIVATSALLLWIPLVSVWHKAAKALQARKFMLSVPVFLLLRPLRSFICMMKSKRIHDAQYAWQSTARP